MRAERCLHKATERDENGNKGNRETWRVFKKKGGRNPAKGQCLEDPSKGVGDTMGQGQMPLASGALHVGFSKATKPVLVPRTPCPCFPAPGQEATI